MLYQLFIRREAGETAVSETGPRAPTDPIV